MQAGMWAAEKGAGHRQGCGVQDENGMQAGMLDAGRNTVGSRVGIWSGMWATGQGAGSSRDVGYRGAGMQDGVGIQDEEQNAGRDVGCRIQEQGSTGMHRDPQGCTGSSASPLPPLPLAIPVSLNPRIQPGMIPGSPKFHPGWEPNPFRALPHSFSWFAFTLRLREAARIPWEEGLGCLGLPEGRRAGDPQLFLWSWCPPVLPRFPRKTRPKPHSRRLLGTAGIWGSTFQVMRGPQAWPHCHLIPEISRIFFWMSTPILPCLRPLGSPLFPVPELSGAHPRFILDISIVENHLEFPTSELQWRTGLALDGF
ncbi:uncharacterized protein LOC120499437 [Passer montanus]|uniref:uncharacterized protein LOC120499437 n=1 Tax=Passer montanus TaxID=9160 RepID=UPI001960773C|nr:uncharacterized protein LOC120499437 [Passer montanus]